jgi:hypothetical protein
MARGFAESGGFRKREAIPFTPRLEPDRLPGHSTLQSKDKRSRS